MWSTTMSSIGRLPNSVLQQILSELLALPYESFAKFGDHNTYWTTRTSTAYTILLVCKRWAAVGQPTLYNGVILRRKKQAETLARTLRDTTIAKGCTGKGTRLARRIRWLRIDNIQCMAVEKIIRAATNVEEIHLSHTMPTSRSKGIDWLAAFRCISPRRLHLSGVYGYTIKERAELRRGVCDKDILPYFRKHTLALREALDYVLHPSEEGPPSWSRCKEVRADRHFMFERSPLGTLNEVQVAAPSPSPNSGLSADRLPYDVWRNIISYLLYDFGDGDYSTLDHTIKRPEGLYRTRTNLALVSKRFASFAEPLALLNAFPIQETDLVEKLDERLKTRPELARYIRVLALPDFFDYVQGRPSFRQECIQVVDWDLPGLRLCCGFLFGTLSRSGPPVLRKFPASVRTVKLFGDALNAMGLCLDSSPCLSVDLFSDARNLTTLVLDGHLLREPECPTPPEVLSRLKKLELNMQNGYSTTTCLTTLDLPSLEEVHFHNLADSVTVRYMDPCANLAIFSFCQKHGAKLKRLTIGSWRNTESCDRRILDLCPRLETLTIYTVHLKLGSRLLKPQQPHCHLRCIDFKFCTNKISETDVDMMLNLLFDSAGSTMLVALEEFRLERGGCRFPDSEISGPNEPIERFARELYARYPHIHLADSCGRRWGRF